MARQLIITEKMLEEMEASAIIEMLSERERDIISAELCDAESGIMSSIMDCESPIERLLAIGMYSVSLCYMENFYPDIVVGGIYPQSEIVANEITYRVDFSIPVLYKNESEHHFIIECDGHDFHEKTKQQAQRDRQRERNLIAAGYTVIRFTGSEIYNSPYKCAKEIIQIIIKHFIGG